MKHLILRFDNPPATRKAGLRNYRSAQVAKIGTLRCELEDISSSNAEKLRQKPEVMAIAPMMPMKLIAPLPSQGNAGDAPKEPTDVAWGIRAVAADTSPFTGDGVTVAVLDTGIDAQHQAFTHVTQKLVLKNFTSDPPDDLDGHGTHCAATIFGGKVNDMRIGVAPGIKKALIGKVLGKDGGSDVIVQAIQWAVSEGAHVISMSLSLDFPGYVRNLGEQGFPVELATSLALDGYRANLRLFDRLVSFLAAQGEFRPPTLLIAAAGNQSQREVREDFTIHVSPPAVSEGILSVGALGRGPGGLVIAPFSNTGARVCGPGVDILSAKAGGGLISLNGTSMATPHVAGVAVLWAESLISQQDLIKSRLPEQLVSSATTGALQKGFNKGDVGAGLVQSPQ